MRYLLNQSHSWLSKSHTPTVHQPVFSFSYIFKRGSTSKLDTGGGFNREKGGKGLTRRKEKMIHPTKIHLAISNRTGTAQSSPHFLAIVVVHWALAICVDSSGKRHWQTEDVEKEENEENEK
jgi:hypothetical protein